MFVVGIRLGFVVCIHSVRSELTFEFVVCIHSVCSEHRLGCVLSIDYVSERLCKRVSYVWDSHGHVIRPTSEWICVLVFW